MGKKLIKKNRSMLVLALTLLFLGVVLFLNFGLLYQNAKKNLLAMKENELLQSAKEFGNFYVESAYTIKAVAYSLEMMQTEQASSDEMLLYLQKQSRIYAKLVDNNSTGLYGWIGGEYLDGSGWIPDEDFDPKERPWYQTAFDAKGKVAFVSPYVDSQTGNVMISICKLLGDRKSVVSLDVSLNGTQTLVEQTAVRGNWKSALVADEDGFIVAHSDKQLIGRDYLKDPNGLGSVISDKMNALVEQNFEVVNNGITYEVFVAPVWDKWHAIAIVEAKSLFASLHKLYYLFFASLIMIFVFITGVYLLIKRNLRNEVELNRQFKAIAGIFVTVHYIDLKEDSFFELAVNADYVRVILDQYEKNAQMSLRMVMDSMTDQRYKKSMYSFIDFATLSERLQGRNSIAKEFVSMANRKCRGVFVPVAWDADGKLKSVLWMVEVVDERGE